MKRLKLRSERGETLVEVLASVLIVTLSVMMLVGSVMASSRVDVETEKLDKKHYKALTSAETHGGDEMTGMTVTIKGSAGTVTPDITIYGDAGAGMYSYVRKES